MRFTDLEVRTRGLTILKISTAEQQKRTERWKNEIFRKLYGSPPCVVRQMWDDLIDTNILECKLDIGETNHTGLRMLLIAHYFLWTYPRNSQMLEAHFSPICEKETRGDRLWHWIKKICLLMPSRIHWLERFDQEDSEAFIATIDGIDCKVWEPRKNHPDYHFDPGMYSHKFKRAAWKYEIAVAIFSDNIVWVNGPWRGGKGDLGVLIDGQEEALELGLIDSILVLMIDGKFLIADRGYKTSEAHLMDKIAYRRNDDPEELARFKARVLSRHETVNSCLKQFRILSDTFRNKKEKHEIAFKAVCLIVQYHLDMNIGFLFDA
jgi:hypothetical protein